MPDTPLNARSLSEAYLYLMVQPCTLCGEGALSAGEGRRLGDEGDTVQVDIAVACRSCAGEQVIRFQLPDDRSLIRSPETATFSTSDEPSRLIDIAQWLTLFRMMVEAAAVEPDKQASRDKGLEAAQCLEEALKFYEDAENDLPPDSAFFSESTRRRRREHPEQFSRRRLVEMRAKLPTRHAMPHGRGVGARKPWWRLW